MLLRYISAGPEVIPDLGGRTVSSGDVLEVTDRIAFNLLATGRWEKVGLKQKSRIQNVKSNPVTDIPDVDKENKSIDTPLNRAVSKKRIKPEKKGVEKD